MAVTSIPSGAIESTAVHQAAVSPAAVLSDASKLYDTFVALRRITLTLERGRCYVLLGENGAGKSTLLRMLAGLLKPSHGSVQVLGFPAEDAREQVGYMSHAPMLYDEFSGLENMHYYAKLYAGAPCLAPEAALRLVSLDPELKRPVAKYSQGMRQRASLARVLLPQPQLLLLDEPFSNMDRASAEQMLSLLATLRDQGRTVVLTTHQRELAEPIADTLITLSNGAVISQTPGPHARDLLEQGSAR